MPIRPENRKLYAGGSPNSKEWKAIRAQILDRANHVCEGSPAWPDCRAVNYEPHPVTGSRVILTIAHMDHNPSNNDFDNLRALCQKCHLNYDAPHKKKMRAVRKYREEVTSILHRNISDNDQAEYFYCEVSIAAFNNQTIKDIVENGRGKEVVDFLNIYLDFK